MTDPQQDKTLAAHIENLKGIPATKDRNAYMEIVERKDGKQAADYIRAQYTKWWEYRDRQRKAGVR